MLKTTIYKIESDNTENQTDVHQEGSCKNGLLVLAKTEDLTEDNRKMLSQMLNAIKHNLEDSCLVALQENQKVASSEFISQHSIKKILSFGISPKDIGLQIAVGAYQLIEMESLKIVFSHPLSDLAADKQKKIKLWNAIQGL